MLCDCNYRRPQTIMENRAYTHQQHNVSAYYKWWRGWPDRLSGHWGHPPFLNATQCQPSMCGPRNCTADECRPSPHWTLPLTEALQAVSVLPVSPCPNGRGGHA